MIVKLPDMGRLLAWAGGSRAFVGPRQLRDYWEGLRPQGGIPDRSALDPRGLAGVLDRVFLAERIGRGLVQLRIAGSALAEVAGMDLRGLPLSCLFRPEARPALAEALEAVTQGAVLAELDLTTGGRAPVAQMLLLPLTDGKDQRLVLGCLGFAGAGLSARKGFVLHSRREERLTPGEVAPPAPPLRRFGHLTLVHSAE